MASQNYYHSWYVQFKKWWSWMGVTTNLMALLIKEISWLLRLYLLVNISSSFLYYFRRLILHGNIKIFLPHCWVIYEIQIHHQWKFFSSFTYLSATILVVSFPYFSLFSEGCKFVSLYDVHNLVFDLIEWTRNFIRPWMSTHC